MNHFPDDEAHEKSLERAKDKYAAKKLLDLMQELSEMHYAAGWMHNLEFMLWGDITHDEPVQFAGGCSWASELLLKQHSKDAGGWWYWDPEQGALFEPTADFEKRYAEWKASPRGQAWIKPLVRSALEAIAVKDILKDKP